METTARRGGRGTSHRGGWRGGDRGGSRGGDRDRGRGRGSYGGSYQTDERQWGFGRGGDQSDRGGLSAPGRGRGRGGISGEQKVQISSAVRPTTIQVSSEGTDDIIVAVSATNTIQDFARTVLAKKDFTLGNNQLRIRMFVNSCLLNLSNHHNVDVSGLLPALASSSGSSQLKEILLMPMGIDDATSPSRLSFQFVVLPLVGVLTRESVCQSTIGSESNTIYSAVYDHRQKFIEEGIIPCMQKLLSRGSLADSSPAADQIQQQHRYLCVVTSLPCALLAIVRLVYQIVTRTRDAPVTLATTVEKLASQAQICAQISNGTDRDQFVNQILSREVKRLQAIVSDTQDNIIPFTDDTADSSRLTRVPNMVHLHNAFDPPGDLSVNGPRHDNDLVNITAINIFPTHQEINCSRTPFLPSNGIPDAPHFLAHGWKRQVDTHFRLYREDMMQPLRQSIVAFLSTMQRTPAEKMDHLLKPKELRKALGDNVRLNVYGDIQFLGLAVDKHAGCSIEIEFAQPQQILGSKRKGQRAEFWERSKNRLMQGGLVCLVKRGVGLSAGDQDGSTSNFELVLAEVVRRDKGAMSVNEEVARITISLADPLKYLTLLNSTSKTSSKQWFLVESPGAYFGAYRPILRALQRSIPASLPFGKYLAPTVEEQAQIRNVSNFVDPPIYARAPTFQYNLAVLLQGKECKLDVSSATSIKQAVRTLQNNSTLDDTQATALVDTLCREVALINGPPGTGKTYIGTALMQVLLGNKDRSKCGPILCICYTNHALDQFLEHLLDKGIPKIVRVGARSKSERLEKYNLQTLMADVDRSYHMRKELREINAELESNAEEIEVLERAMKKDCVTWDNVQAHLKQDYPDLYEQFVKPRSSSLDTFDISGNEGDGEIEDDGNGEFFQVEDKKFRNLHPFESWKQGQDIQEKIKWNARAKENWENRSKKSPRRRSKKKSKRRITVLDFDGKNGARLQPNQPPVPKTIPSSNRPVLLLRESNIWSMSKTERKSLLDQWRPEIQETLMDHLSSVVKNVQTLNEAKNGAFDEIRCGVLRQCSVVGMTTNGAAKCQELIKKMAPKIIICEEAGEVLESHILSALSSATQHLIMIGDHKQLRPQIETYDLSSDSPKGMMYNLDKSLFERLVTSVKNPLPMSILTTQRRMRPCISNLIRGPLYSGLEDGDNVHHYPPVCGMGENLYFLHHDHPEDAKDAYGMQSFSNSFEVDMAKAFATYLIKNGYDKPGDIAVLTPYLGQLSKLRDSMKDSFMLVIDDRDQEQLDQKVVEEVVEETTVQGVTPGAKNLSLQNHLTLRTIDNYQGEEAKIIIISLVRNNAANDRVASGRIGFLKSPNRTNVLLSRAQHGMFILGNATLMEREKNGIWPSVIKELRDHNRIGKGFPLMCKNHPTTIRSVGSAAQLKAMAPHGGCDQACGYGMPCGHACPLECHPDDIEHRLVRCLQPCDRLHSICQHVCRKKCSEPCGDCKQIVGPLELSCGHTLEKLSCHQKKNPSTIFCRVLVTRALPACEHEKEMECHEDPTNVLCKVKIVRSLPTCGHKKEMECHEDPTKVPCKVKVVRSLPTCGHEKEMACHEDPTNVLCKVKIVRSLPTCGHKKEMECHEDPAKVSCISPCASSLPCGHLCTKACSACPASSLLKTDRSKLARPTGEIVHAEHGNCGTKCGKTLSCGHKCGMLCHMGSDCMPCNKPCESACAHGGCRLSCDSPCAVCSKPCNWRCQHQGQCSMPCGVPCDRLPCNERCDKLLSCGHRCPSVCGEACPPPTFCVECKDPVTMDKILSSRLADMDVDKDPILVLSCGHALTMTTMDNMMKMDSYYIPHVNPATGTTRYIAKQPLPGDEVKQVSCPACQKPIVHLLRYGRRIKDAQMGKNLKKYQIAQKNALTDARDRFKDVRAEIQTNRTTYMQSLSSIKADPKVAPPSPNSRKLGKFMQEADPFPFTNFWTISKSYGIPPVHRAAWAKCMFPLRAMIMILNGINNEAAKSPTKDAFEVAYSHFYQLHTANAPPLADAEGHFTDGIYVDEVDPDEASAMIQDRIVECGLPADGYGGSSYVESLAEKTTILLWVLHHALVTLEFVGPMTGWYWFVEDLCNCCLVYTELLIEAAMNGRCYQRTALSRVILLDLMSHQARWMNLRLQAGDKGTNEARSKLADSLALAFAEELKELMESCPVSMKKWCLERVEKIKHRLVTEVKLARGDLSLQRSEFDGIRVIRIKLNKIGEPNTWHRCANGHTYVESGTATQPSSCPECRSLVGGGDHVLLGDV